MSLPRNASRPADSIPRRIHVARIRPAAPPVADNSSGSVTACCTIRIVVVPSESRVANSRAREFATRLSLGTTTMRIVQQAVTEPLLLSATGGAAGLILATWILRGIESAGLDALRGKDIVLDWPTLAYSLLL